MGYVGHTSDLVGVVVGLLLICLFVQVKEGKDIVMEECGHEECYVGMCCVTWDYLLIKSMITRAARKSQRGQP